MNVFVILDSATIMMTVFKLSLNFYVLDIIFFLSLF